MPTCVDGRTPSLHSHVLRLSQAPRITCECFTGACIGRHVHQYFELVYVVAGGGIHGINQTFQRGEAGDIFLVAPGEIHDPSGLADAVKWVVAFSLDALVPSQTDADPLISSTDSALLAAFMAQLSHQRTPLHVDEAQRSIWESLLTRLAREIREQRAGFVAATRSLLIVLLTDVARLSTTSTTTGFSSPLWPQVWDYIERHYPEPIGAHDIAAALGYSPAYLTDLMRRETGRPLQTWITERRMAEARYRLAETNEAIQRIAYAVGYRQAPYFTRQFHHLHGLSPRAWRNLYLR